MTARLTVADQCDHDLGWLALDEQAATSIYPRALYPSLDDALTRASVGEYGVLDLEEPPARCRLVWAWESEPGYWMWAAWPVALPWLGGEQVVESWEITWHA